VNLAQDLIYVTEDKAYIYLDEWRRKIEGQGGWINPASLLATMTLTLLTADFKDKFNIKKEYWFAVFLVASILTALYLTASIVKTLRGRPESVTQMVEKFKNVSKKSPGI